MDLPVDYNKASWQKKKAAREEYIKRQDGKCFYCHMPLDGKPSTKVLSLKLNRSLFPVNFFKYPVHLHHSHITGKSLGAVHNRCNAVMWEYLNE